MSQRLQQVVDRLYINASGKCLEYPGDLIVGDDFVEEGYAKDIKYLLAELRRAGVKVPKQSPSIKEV